MRESRFVALHHGRTFVEFDGNENAPVMVMLHGLGGSSNYFQPLVDAFSSSHKIIRLDWAGLGRTRVTKITSKITMPGYVKDLEKLFEVASVTEPVILIGHSLGAAIAALYAAKFPEKVQSLVLIGPGRSRAKVPAVKAFTLQMAKNARELGMANMADGTVAKNVAPSSSPVVRAFVREVIAAQDGEGYAQVCEAACDDTHVDPEYGDITARTVIIAGDQDIIAPEQQCKEIQGLVGDNAAFKVVHSGHQQVLEDTEGVIEGIKMVL
jgi:pimeloyl-ACP methyl ester carboxylesterase